jgi:hypothetical protein
MRPAALKFLYPVGTQPGAFGQRLLCQPSGQAMEPQQFTKLFVSRLLLGAHPCAWSCRPVSAAGYHGDFGIDRPTSS